MGVNEDQAELCAQFIAQAHKRSSRAVQSSVSYMTLTRSRCMIHWNT